MKRWYATCAECGAGMKKADTSTCGDCRRTLCPSHTRLYIDGNNAAITRHMPPFCAACFEARWGPDLIGPVTPAVMLRLLRDAGEVAA